MKNEPSKPNGCTREGLGGGLGLNIRMKDESRRPTKRLRGNSEKTEDLFGDERMGVYIEGRDKKLWGGKRSRLAE